LYRLTGDNEPQLLWETTDWIGEPAWSRSGHWLFFTRWRNDGGSHDLWVLPASGGEPQRVTDAPSWESHVTTGQAHDDALPPTLTTRAPVATQVSPLALGFNVANLDNSYLSHDLGFGWAKGFADWERAEAEPGAFRWIDIDNTVQRTEEAGLQLLLRVDRSPTWARPPDTTGSHPPTDLNAYARFWETLATRYRGRVAAYELWNEPNLSLEWGNQRPDPAYYVEMLRVVHATLQRIDPDAILIVGALAVTGEGNDRSMGELEWMRGFYEALGPAEPRPYDAFSTHPYGFGQPPDFPVEAGLGLRRLEEHRALMEQWGDSSPLWLTELGYPRRTPGWSLGEHEHWVVSDDDQARYLVETLDWIEGNYPFVEAVFFFNLDFSTVDWYSADEQMRAYAILDSSRAPLPAFTALRQRWLGR
nr:cellulase family glycosylhydrolase [Ardenticatenales bacterium]